MLITLRFSWCNAIFFHLPFRDDEFRFVSQLFIFTSFQLGEGGENFDVAIYKAGRLGMVVNDLHRSRIAHTTIFILTRIFTRNRLTRYDAPVSVMNAFTPKEFCELAQQAEIDPYEIHRHFPYRIALLGRKT